MPKNRASLPQHNASPTVFFGAIDLGGSLGNRAERQLARLSLHFALCRCKLELHAAPPGPRQHPVWKRLRGCGKASGGRMLADDERRNRGVKSEPVCTDDK